MYPEKNKILASEIRINLVQTFIAQVVRIVQSSLDSWAMGTMEMGVVPHVSIHKELHTVLWGK